MGLLRGEGKPSEAEKKGLRSFSSTSAGFSGSGSEERDKEIEINIGIK